MVRLKKKKIMLDLGHRMYFILHNETYFIYSCLHNSRHETFHFEKKKMSCELNISVNFAWNDLNLFLSYSLKNRLVHHNKILLI